MTHSGMVGITVAVLVVETIKSVLRYESIRWLFVGNPPPFIGIKPPQVGAVKGACCCA